jgi:fibronectin type 3 domain-containing protein
MIWPAIGLRWAATEFIVWKQGAATTARLGEKQASTRMALIAALPASATAYLDSQFDFGTTYSYSVRSVVENSGKELESADSNVPVVLAKTALPPAAPENLVAVSVPAQPGAPAHIELSWQISPEPDVAGYNLYRSGQAGVPGTRQNMELLLTPAFRDMNVVPSGRYSYSVTAVDRSGNESSPSAAVSGEVPAESPPQSIGHDARP